MALVNDHNKNYVVWQNRATRFYVAARALYLTGLFAPASYCGVIALELILKATLIYHDRSFQPLSTRHNADKLIQKLREKVPGAQLVSLPLYFFHENRFLVVSRYPTDEKGLTVPSSFLPDLDWAFVGLLQLTQFQHNTELKRLLFGPSTTERRSLVRGNRAVRRMRSFLRPAHRQRA